ncbi:hypothetical protein [Leucobacter luti]|uniref:hypothetical protein n=1 Tax=Leucobacter luti TaxID=340320 RepID=UPI001C692B6B|nr:hypothetical protein [Leucobacter luti]QYM75601.1 hypothetical protein K1X41_13420 [Leucobacter luti]
MNVPVFKPRKPGVPRRPSEDELPPSVPLGRALRVIGIIRSNASKAELGELVRKLVIPLQQDPSAEKVTLENVWVRIGGTNQDIRVVHVAVNSSTAVTLLSHMRSSNSVRLSGILPAELRIVDAVQVLINDGLEQVVQVLPVQYL